MKSQTSAGMATLSFVVLRVRMPVIILSDTVC